MRTDGAPHQLSLKLSQIQISEQAGYVVNDLFNSAVEKPRYVNTDTQLTIDVNPSGKVFLYKTAYCIIFLFGPFYQVVEFST